jgi:hypothetical protein
LDGTAITREKALEYTRVKVETQLRTNNVLFYDLNIVTICTLELHASFFRWKNTHIDNGSQVALCMGIGFSESIHHAAT